jgi:hypothetical protein
MTDDPTASKLPGIDFGRAFEATITPEVQKIASETNEAMPDETLEDLLVGFEFAAKQDDAGNEFWDARDLARLLDYSDYRNFLNIVEKAKESSRTAGISTDDHFVDATDMVDIGSGAVREVQTVLLSRYACYLIAQNGDARKRPIAFAQTYFAVQARRQEIQDRDIAAAAPLPKSESDPERTSRYSRLAEAEAGTLRLMPDPSRTYAWRRSVQPRIHRVRTSYPLRAPYPRLQGPSILHSRPQTFLRQVRYGPSGCRIARTLPPTLHAGPQRLSRRDSGLHPIAPRLHPR